MNLDLRIEANTGANLNRQIETSTNGADLRRQVEPTTGANSHRRVETRTIVAMDGHHLQPNLQVTEIWIDKVWIEIDVEKESYGSKQLETDCSLNRAVRRVVSLKR